MYKWLAINWMMIPSLSMGNGWKSPFPSMKKTGWIWSSGGIVLGLVNFLLLQGNPQFFGDETRVPEGGTELANINHGLKR